MQCWKQKGTGNKEKCAEHATVKHVSNVHRNDKQKCWKSGSL